jgi:hypothetical protein
MRAGVLKDYSHAFRPCFASNAMYAHAFIQMQAYIRMYIHAHVHIYAHACRWGNEKEAVKLRKDLFLDGFPDVILVRVHVNMHEHMCMCVHAHEYLCQQTGCFLSILHSLTPCLGALLPACTCQHSQTCHSMLCQTRPAFILVYTYFRLCVTYCMHVFARTFMGTRVKMYVCARASYQLPIYLSIYLSVLYMNKYPYLIYVYICIHIHKYMHIYISIQKTYIHRCAQRMGSFCNAHTKNKNQCTDCVYRIGVPPLLVATFRALIGPDTWILCAADSHNSESAFCACMYVCVYLC